MGHLYRLVQRNEEQISPETKMCVYVRLKIGVGWGGDICGDGGDRFEVGVG